MKIMLLLSTLGLAILCVSSYNKVIRQPKCLYMADVGPCTDQVQVFGYDYLTNRCVPFMYGGCGGNPNRFNTKEECMKECYVESEESVEDEVYLLDDLYMKNEL